MQLRRLFTPTLAGITALIAVTSLAAAPSTPQPLRHLSANGSDILSVEYLEDATAQLTIDDVTPRTDWIASDPTLNLGLSMSAFWLRIKILNRDPEGTSLHLQFNDPTLQHIHAYVPRTPGDFEVIRLGFLEPSPYRNRFGSPKHMFPVNATAGEDVVHYVRVKSPTPLGLTMKLRGEAEAFQEARQDGWTFGFIYGIFLFMPLYNFVVFLFSRDRSFLLLAMFAASLGTVVCIVEGHLSIAFPELNLFVKDRMHHVFGAMSYILLLLLARNMLSTQINTPRLDKWLTRLVYIVAIIPIGCLFGNHYLYTVGGLVMTLTVSIFALTLGFASLRKTKMAIFFLIGFTSFIAGSVIFVMQQTGAIESNFLTIHAVHFGGIFEEIFLGFAVAFKIRDLNRSLKQRAYELETANINLSAEMVSREKISKELGVQRAIAIHASKMRAIGELASSIAHQVNNPLAILRMKIDNLMFSLERLEISEDQKRKLIDQFGGADRNISRIARITNSLLRLSRNSEREEKVSTPVREILSEALDICVDRFEEHNVKIRVLGMEDVNDLELLCHSTDVSQALLNLLKNSYDAIFRTKDAWIEVKTTLSATELTMAVTDSGSGIPADLRDKIMQPFFTTKESGKGTGVGLSIAKDLVTGSGGTIVLDADCPNTRFVISFPLHACKRVAATDIDDREAAVS